MGMMALGPKMPDSGYGSRPMASDVMQEDKKAMRRDAKQAA